MKNPEMRCSRNRAVWQWQCAAALALWLCAATPVFAQQGAPPSGRAGRIEQQTETPRRPRADPAPLVGRVALEMQPDAAQDIEVQLASVTIVGANVYSAEQLKTHYEDLLGQRVTLGQIFGVAEGISRRYRDDGWILSRALVPAGQDLDARAARVKIQVIEGFIEGVQLQGFDGEEALSEESSRRLRSYLQKIPRSCHEQSPTATCPLHRDVLERYLLLARDLGGMEIQSILAPGSKSGAARLVVRARQRHVGAYARIHNRGSDFVGPGLYTLGGRLHSIFGRNATTQLEFVGSAPDSEEVALVRGGIGVPVNSEGTTVLATASYSKGEPGDRLEVLEIETDTWVAGLRVEHPLWRSRLENLSLFGSLSARQQKTDSLGVELIDDRIQSLELGFAYDRADALLGGAISLFELTLDQGLPIDATEDDDPMRSTGGDGVYTLLRARVSRLQRLSDHFALHLEARGQYALQELLVAKLFAYGGEQIGRGYDPSELLGDHGLSGIAELRFTPPWDTDLPIGDGVRFDFEPYLYLDGGVAWLRDHDCPACIGSRSQRDASSAGGGLRLRVSDHVSGYVEVGVPFRRVAAEGEREPRFFFGVAARF